MPFLLSRRLVFANGRCQLMMCYIISWVALMCVHCIYTVDLSVKKNQFILLLGHSALIGSRTGQVLSYAVRCKNCRVCEHAK